MKKIAILGLAALLSVGVMAKGNYGQGNNNQGNYKNNQNTQQQQNFRGRGPMANLTEEQQEQVKEILDSKKDAHQKLVLDVRDLQVDIDKELIEDKIDWTKVEKLEAEKAEINAEMAVERLKTRKEIEDKIGVDLPDFENRGNKMMGRNNKGQKGGNKGNMQSRKGQGRGNNGDGQGQGNRGNFQGQGNNMGQGGNQGRGRFANLTDEQKTQMQEIRDNYKTDHQKLTLEVRDIQVDIDRELINDTVDWTKVEKLEKAKAEVKAKLAVSRLKMREEIEEKTGIDMPDFEGKGKRGGQRDGFGRRG